MCGSGSQLASAVGLPAVSTGWHGEDGNQAGIVTS